jgi:hypothetical protein
MFDSFLSRCRFRLILNTPLLKQKGGQTNEMNRDDDEIRKIAEHYKAKAIERLKRNRALQMQEVEKRLGTAMGVLGCRGGKLP